ncbi:hypothetical protein J7T55_003264 [Diaporthe amygdali]|uniref:uncharacterized protein n=1 Tax=Phomopsis amygdali TaxID=1214568 RepID=UPI0022FEE7DB|nr:uncharacterized protein J7T55_003264 [Diaporthe amygdali]KAJ0122748.1 hypothetical protein J7T55_003264 [Diaporthe amygdali]
MSQPSSAIRITEAATIFLSTITAAGNLSLSILVIPRLLESPTPLMLRQWVNSYSLNKVLFPSLGSLSGLAYLFLSYHHHLSAATAKSRAYLGAGLFCFSAIPYTWAFVLPTNRKILRKAEEMKGLKAVEGVEVEEKGVGPRGEESAKWLIDHWGMVNLGRGIVWAVAGMLGLAATV